MCPHSKRDTPDRCSRCLEAAGQLEAPVRRVDQAAGLVLVDGIPARPIDVEAQSASRYYGSRGKAASMRVTRSKG